MCCDDLCFLLWLQIVKHMCLLHRLVPVRHWVNVNSLCAVFSKTCKARFSLREETFTRCDFRRNPKVRRTRKTQLRKTQLRMTTKGQRLQEGISDNRRWGRNHALSRVSYGKAQLSSSTLAEARRAFAKGSQHPNNTQSTVCRVT
jgi:hypothetical protein